MINDSRSKIHFYIGLVAKLGIQNSLDHTEPFGGQTCQACMIKLFCVNSSCLKNATS